MFCSFGTVLRKLEDSNDVATPRLSSVFMAGSIAGFFQSVAVCPTELIKCRLQVQDGHGATTAYKGPMDCVRHLYRHNGMRGLFLGWWPTVWRESPSFGVYFLVYEWSKRQMCSDPLDPSMSAMLMAGGKMKRTSCGCSAKVANHLLCRSRREPIMGQFLSPRCHQIIGSNLAP